MHCRHPASSSVKVVTFSSIHHVRSKNIPSIINPASISVKGDYFHQYSIHLEIIPCMSPASISLKNPYFISMNSASSSVILYFFINPASTCTVLICYQARAQASGAQTVGA